MTKEQVAIELVAHVAKSVTGKSRVRILSTEVTVELQQLGHAEGPRCRPIKRLTPQGSI